jgi:hypothetical protein
MDNIELAAGLRALADFYETHPEMPLPSPVIHIFAQSIQSVRMGSSFMLEDAASTEEKIDEPGGVYPQYHLRRRFGVVTLELLAHMGIVGRKVMKNILVETWELIPEEPSTESSEVEA